MFSEIMWLIGVSVTVLVAVGGMVITGFRNANNKASAGDKTLHEKIDNVNRDVNDRIDRVKDNYVRRDDFDGFAARVDAKLGHMEARMESGHKELRDDIRHGQTEVNSRLDTLISHYTVAKATSGSE